MYHQTLLKNLATCANQDQEEQALYESLGSLSFKHDIETYPKMANKTHFSKIFTFITSYSRLLLLSNTV